MKKILFFILPVLMFFIIIFSTETAAKLTKQNGKDILIMDIEKKNDMETLYNKMYEFMINKDILSLGKMLDDNFVLVHMTGLKQNKKEYLNSIKNGTLNYFSNDTENIIVENDSKFIGQSKVSAAVFGGGTHTWNLELTIELTENNLIKKISASTY